MGIHKLGGLDKYLGVPENIGKSKYDAFSYLTQRIQEKLVSWSSKLISPAGREVLIKVVAMSLPNYTMSCFLLPKRLTDHITSAIRRFLWSTDPTIRKIPWIAWSKITRSKKHGGLGIRDLQCFNIALLAKQGWRLLNYPHSLLARVYKAKYFRKSSFLQAYSRPRDSFAWKSIIKTQSLLTHGIRWRVGNGRSIQVWSDNWLPSAPSRPAQGPGSVMQPNLTVRDLIKPGSGEWDRQKLELLLTPEDVSLAMQIRPSHGEVEDHLSWIYTTSGEYTAKSGYYLSLNLQVPNQTIMGLPQKLYAAIWKLNIPPKLKHFWWRVSHNSLPVGENLVIRGCLKDKQCPLCGDLDETVNHLLFQCRVSREVWELAPLPVPHSNHLATSTLYQNLEWFLITQPTSQDDHTLFSFIGWRIWKMRNNLIFQQRREAIPQVINNSILDHELWRESHQLAESMVSPLHNNSRDPPINECIPSNSSEQGHLTCLVDASWISVSHRAGIGWILRNASGQKILTGKGTIAPTTTPNEAEALALYQAVKELRKLHYTNVTFQGDCKSIYDELHHLTCRPQLPLRCTSTTATIVYDIAALASPTQGYSFQAVKRSVVGEADLLAKTARLQNIMYTITWVSM